MNLVGNEIKLPRLDGNDAETRQELRVFARQVKESVEYLSVILEAILEKSGGDGE